MVQKRVNDYILAQHAHLVFDADRSYPLGGINPRPPLFTWSRSWCYVDSNCVTNFSRRSSLVNACIAGYLRCLDCIPIVPCSRPLWKRSWSNLSMVDCILPSHVTHSTWALQTTTRLFFCSCLQVSCIIWWAVKAGGNERITRKVSAHPNALFKAISDVTIHKKAAIANAVAAGVCIGLGHWMERIRIWSCDYFLDLCCASCLEHV